jgi:hypothetical protein
VRLGIQQGRILTTDCVILGTGALDGTPPSLPPPTVQFAMPPSAPPGRSGRRRPAARAAAPLRPSRKDRNGQSRRPDGWTGLRGAKNRVDDNGLPGIRCRVPRRAARRRARQRRKSGRVAPSRSEILHARSVLAETQTTRLDRGDDLVIEQLYSHGNATRFPQLATKLV